MSGHIHISEDGTRRWIPPSPQLPSQTKWGAFKTLRQAWTSPLRCGVCRVPVTYFESQDMSRHGDRGRFVKQERLPVEIACRVQVLADTNTPAKDGSDLIICTWRIFTPRARVRACKECQELAIRRGYIDLTDEVNASVGLLKQLHSEGVIQWA